MPDTRDELAVDPCASSANPVWVIGAAVLVVNCVHGPSGRVFICVRVRVSSWHNDIFRRQPDTARNVGPVRNISGIIPGKVLCHVTRHGYSELHCKISAN